MIQEQTLNAILQRNDSSIITLNNLTSDYFSDYRSEFLFIQNHIKQYSNVPDMETFLATFPDFQVINVNEPTTYLLEELQKDKNKRFLAENYSKVRQLIMDNKVDEAMSILKQASEESVSFTTMNAIDLIHDTSRYDAYTEKLSNFNKYFITTGFPELDKLIGGWSTEDELAVIIARPNIGKSWVALKCAAEAAKAGKNVGIYSGEMTDKKVGYRIDTMLGHLSNGALVHGNASIKNEYKKYLDTLSENITGNLHVITPGMINGPAGVSALRAFIEKYNLDILFIDQHSLLEDDRKAKNPVEKAANISKDLKILQTLKKIPIITVSQQNRDKLEDGKVFDLSQIAASDRIGQDATSCIFIDRKDDLMRLYLMKSRDSENGKVLTYKIDLNTGLWVFVPEETNQELNESNSNTAIYNEDEVF